MLTKPPLSVLEAGKNIGDIKSNGKNLIVETVDDSISTTFAGHYDNVAGVLSLDIPGYPRIRFSGFLTNRDLKEGRQGQIGDAGTDGINGLDGNEGDEGTRGCVGPRGPRGLPGERGMGGQRGPTGSRGAKGEEGDQGKPGELMMYFQNEDPGPVGASAIWVKL